MNIAICDDNIEFLNKIYNDLNSIVSDIKDEKIEILTFSSGEEFLAHYQVNKNIDIIFLDILMKNVNGMEVAKRIRKRDSKMIIFFLTSIKHYAIEGYNVNASGYLLKPVEHNKLKRELLKAIDKIKRDRNQFIIEKNDSGLYKIYFDEIVYIETSSRNTVIHLLNEDIVSYKSMKKHLEVLGKNHFFRIHEAYIVNLKYIKKVLGYDIELSNGTVLNVSKKRKKDFMSRLSSYYGDLF